MKYKDVLNVDHAGAIICEMLRNQELVLESVIQLIFIGLMASRSKPSSNQFNCCPVTIWGWELRRELSTYREFMKRESEYSQSFAYFVSITSG